MNRDWPRNTDGGCIVHSKYSCTGGVAVHSRGVKQLKTGVTTHPSCENRCDFGSWLMVWWEVQTACWPGLRRFCGRRPRGRPPDVRRTSGVRESADGVRTVRKNQLLDCWEIGETRGLAVTASPRGALIRCQKWKLSNGGALKVVCASLTEPMNFGFPRANAPLHLAQ